MMTTSNNDEHDLDHDHGASITSPRKALLAPNNNKKQHNKSENNIYSIMSMGNNDNSMSSLPSSLERSCSIIDLSLSLANCDEDADGIDTETQNENNKNETVAKKDTPTLPPSLSSSSSSILSTPSSSILPRSATRMPLLPRRGLFQEQDTQRQPPPQHDRARILERYNASHLEFPILPSSSRRSPVLLPSPISAFGSSITNNRNGTTFSLKMMKKKKRSSFTKVEHHHHYQAHVAVAPEETPDPQDCCRHPKKKGRRDMH